MAESSGLETRAKHAPGTVRDPEAEPSAEWGWHGTFPRTTRIGGWAIAVIFLLMMIGNHTGNIENLWMIGLSLTIIGALVWDQMRRRTSWRR